jgi:hypothetical protein
MICHAIPSQRKEHCCQQQGKDKAVPRTQKGWSFRKRRWVELKGINGIRDQHLKKQLCLRKERTSGRISEKVTGLEIMKRTVGFPVRI